MSSIAEISTFLRTRRVEMANKLAINWKRYHHEQLGKHDVSNWWGLYFQFAPTPRVLILGEFSKVQRNDWQGSW